MPGPLPAGALQPAGRGAGQRPASSSWCRAPGGEVAPLAKSPTRTPGPRAATRRPTRRSDG
eukprot:2206893-Lingulodinium_polyedra.AAC.1